MKELKTSKSINGLLSGLLSSIAKLVCSPSRLVRQIVILFFACNLTLIYSEPVLADSQVGVEVSHIGDATHLEFSGAAEWKYNFKRDGNSELVLRLSGLKSDSQSKLRGLSDSLVKSVKINDKGIDNSTEISFSVSPNTDYFDYISDQPSRLIVDFFPKEDSKNDSKKDPKKDLKIDKSTENIVDKKSAAMGSQTIEDSKRKVLPKKDKPTASPNVNSEKIKSASVQPNDVNASEESDDEAEGDDDVRSAEIEKTTPMLKGRKPAADGTLIVKGVLPEGPSLAEQISSKKDFNHGIFDGGDPEFKRFGIKDYEVKEDAIIASKANFYLPFPMLELGVPQLRALFSVPPTYEITPKETRENKEARVILKLYADKNRALFLKTAEEFLNSYSNSNYDEIIRYLVADAHYDIYRASNSVQDFEISMNMYLSLSEKYPQSPMVSRTILLMGYSYLEHGDSFGALKEFQRFARLHGNSKHLDRVRISTAEAYLRLNRFDDTLTLLEQIEKTGTTQRGREESAFRRGDVFFRRKDYDGAIREYQNAIQKYPAAATRFANAYYNIAEAEFVKGKYRESLESYRVFLQKFPDHNYGGYAMTRMGELLGIFGADPKRIAGAYMESVFRYRSTPGAGVARIRTLTSRMTDMKDKELTSALREIEEITEKYANRPKKEKKNKTNEKAIASAAPESGPTADGQRTDLASGEPVESEDGLRLVPEEGSNKTARPPELPGIEEFSTLLIADGFTARHQYDDSAQKLIAYYQKNPHSPNKEKIKIRIERNMSEGIRTAVEKGNFIEALRQYSKNAGGWLKNTDRIDVRYNTGRAYEQAGVLKEAETIYSECAKKLLDLKGKSIERERNVFESLPKLDAVELRLASVLVKAKEFALAENHLKKISQGPNQAPQLNESELIERAEVSAQVAEARGRPEIARKYLTELVNTWRGDVQLTSPLHFRLAKLEKQTRNYRAADSHLAKILEWKKQEGTRVSDDIHAQALEFRGDLLVARGKRMDAVKAYRELLSDYESKRPLESVRYRLGQVLYQDGDLKSAENEWKQLKPSKDGIWQRLASEEMQGAKWQDEYKKYLNRIPAASDLRDGQESETR